MKIFYGLVLFLVLFSSSLYAEKPSDIKKTEEDVRKEMISWSQELGVTCTQCHNPKNFKEEHGTSFKVALAHARLVIALRENGMDGAKGPQANCFVCHRGELHPPARPKEK